MASSAFEADVYQHIEAIKAANVYAAMSGSIEAVQPAEALQRTLDVEWLVCHRAGNTLECVTI